jgi:hypothetical protein
MLRQPCWFTNLIGLIFGYGFDEEVDLPLIFRHYRLNTTIGINTAAYCVIQIEKHDDLVVINHPTRGCYITTVGDLILENHKEYPKHLENLGYTKIEFVQGAIKVLDHPLKYIRSHKLWVGNGTGKIAVKYYSDPVEIKVLPGDFDLPLILKDDGFYYFDDENYFRADYQQSICRFEDWLELREMLNQIRLI